MEIEQFLSPAQEQKIVETIVEAEKQTSGEIRVHLNEATTLNYYKHAQEVFSELSIALQTHFPNQGENKNQLPDAISKK
ncbi:MAG: hypothetical protein C4K58_06325 [Flavobacteriaceae bacterium]|nr:MAG: hypothetical protein C4K58_06325 [Flavobacteriaceae bacterium]